MPPLDQPTPGHHPGAPPPPQQAPATAGGGWGLPIPPGATMPVPNPQMPQPPAGAMPPLPAFPGELGIACCAFCTMYCRVSFTSHVAYLGTT